MFLLCLVASLASASAQALTLKVGDVLSIRVIGYSMAEDVLPVQDETTSTTGQSAPSISADGKFQVMTDGTIDSHSFGVLHVEGLTLAKVTQLVRKKLSSKFKDPLVSVVLLQQAPSLVYLSGAKSVTGPIHLAAGMDVRQLLSSREISADPDLYEAHIFRQGQADQKANLQDLLTGISPLSTMKLQGNDVVAILPIEFARVWVTGQVLHPGQVSIRKGDDVYRAIASAGGVTNDVLTQSDAKIVLHRGPQVKFFPAKEDPIMAPYFVEPGDSLVVTTYNRIVVTVSGEVKTPGKVELLSNGILDQAIAGAGGLLPSGTGREVSVLRDGQIIKANLASSTTDRGFGSFHLQDQDVVLVRQNNRFAIIVGQVKTQGREYFPDGQEVHLIDMIVAAGGIVDRGTSRHVYMGRPDASGKLVIKEYRLDSYLKDGNPAGNPVILPGDVVSVQNSKQSTVEAVSNILSGAALIYGISRL